MALNVPLQDRQRNSPEPPQVPDHELLRCIGSGSYGDVWLARNIMGTYRAVKVVYRSRFSDDRPYEREFHGMEKFDPVSRTHDGFIDILQMGRNPSEGYYYCVMELADDAVFGQRINPVLYEPKTLGKELAERERLSFEESVQIGASLADALSHLHESGLIHRDIKPSNIIFVNGIPKIADIGLVAEVGLSHSLVGTEGFMPPEGPGTIEADIYSLGKVLYEMSTGQDRKEFPELPANVEEISTRQEFAELNEVILRACERNVQKRYRTAQEMHRDLLLLQAGKSVKRLRMLERRMALIKKAAVLGVTLLVMAGALIYQINREMKIAAERRQQQVARNIAHGNRFIDEGDFFGALPPFVQAMKLDSADPIRQQTHRLRIGSTLRQSSRIENLWFLTSQIHCAQLNSDGSGLAVAGADGKAIILNLTGEQAPITFWENRNEMEGIAFSADGRMAVTASEGRANVWDLTTQQKIATFSPQGTVYNAQFSPDGTQIVTASRTDSEGKVAGYLSLWEARSGTFVTEVGRNGSGYRFASFSPDATRLAVAGEDNRAEIWDISSKTIIATIPHRHWVYSARFSPDGKRVVTASFDSTAQICDAETGGQLVPPLRHPGGVKSAEFSPDGRYVVTACWDFTARLWKARDGKPIFSFLKHTGKHVMYASFMPDGRRVITANANGVISLWDLAPTGFAPPLTTYVYSKNGDVAARINHDRVEVWSADGRSPIATNSASGPVHRVKVNHDGSRLMAFSGPMTNTTTQLFDGLNGTPISEPFTLESIFNDVVFSDEGNEFVGINGSDVEIWDARLGRLRHRFPHDAPAKRTWLNRDATILTSITSEATNTYVWNAATGELLYTFPTTDPVGSVAFSPDGKHLAICSDDGTLFERSVQIWSLETGQKVGYPLKHGDGVTYATFNADGSRILTTSDDTTARVWDVMSGTVLLTLPHKNHVKEACFSPDGRWIATACPEDGSARIWDSETGEAVTPPLINGESFNHVQFAANGRAIVARSSRANTAYWELTLDDHTLGDLERLAQLLSGLQSEAGARGMPRPGALQESWQELREDQARDFSVSQAEVIGWHLREAKLSEAEKNGAAALFHWQQLQRIEPENAAFKMGVDLAHGQADEQASGSQ